MSTFIFYVRLCLCDNRENELMFHLCTHIYRLAVHEAGKYQLGFRLWEAKATDPRATECETPTAGNPMVCSPDGKTNKKRMEIEQRGLGGERKSHGHK